MLGSLDSVEFAEWMVYDRINPFGESRADLRSAIVAVTVNNSAGGKGKLKDFIPSFEPPKKQSATDMINILNLMAKANRGRK